MRASDAGDPRFEAMFGLGDIASPDVRPVVRLPRRGPSTALLIAFAAIIAIALFWLLESRRQAQSEPAVRARPSESGTAFAPPPPLYIPPSPPPATVAQPVLQPAPAVNPAPQPAPVTVPATTYRPAPYPLAVPSNLPPAPLPQPPRQAGGSSVVIDMTAPGAPAPPSAPATMASAVPVGPAAREARVRASTLANRSWTVPQGVLIPAVLETGFDSTRPGFARAIVSRDVRGFDGTRILVPRGSRLIGEYRGEAEPGQKRAVIGWTRIIRPDGVTIALDSPAVDQLGRGGVAASVDTHFWERLSGALLQSSFDLGRVLTGGSSPVVVAMSGSAQSADRGRSRTIAPTLRVPPGQSISVFVAQDLDFAGVGAGT